MFSNVHKVRSHLILGEVRRSSACSSTHMPGPYRTTPRHCEAPPITTPHLSASPHLSEPRIAPLFFRTTIQYRTARRADCTTKPRPNRIIPCHLTVASANFNTTSGAWCGMARCGMGRRCGAQRAARWSALCHYRKRGGALCAVRRGGLRPCYSAPRARRAWPGARCRRGEWGSSGDLLGAGRGRTTASSARRPLARLGGRHRRRGAVRRGYILGGGGGGQGCEMKRLSGFPWPPPASPGQPPPARLPRPASPAPPPLAPAPPHLPRLTRPASPAPPPPARLPRPASSCPRPASSGPPHPARLPHPASSWPQSASPGPPVPTRPGSPGPPLLTSNIPVTPLPTSRFTPHARGPDCCTPHPKAAPASRSPHPPDCGGAAHTPLHAPAGLEPPNTRHHPPTAKHTLPHTPPTHTHHHTPSHTHTTTHRHTHHRHTTHYRVHPPHRHTRATCVAKT
jgi:hypothetical protein